MLMEGGLSKEESFAVAAALHKLGVEEPSDLADVDEKYARQAADAAGLKHIAQTSSSRSSRAGPLRPRRGRPQPWRRTSSTTSR